MNIRIRLFHVKRDFYSQHKIVPNRRRWAGCFASRRTQHALELLERAYKPNDMMDFLRSVGIELRPEPIVQREVVH